MKHSSHLISNRTQERKQAHDQNQRNDERSINDETQNSLSHSSDDDYWAICPYQRYFARATGESIPEHIDTIMNKRENFTISEQNKYNKLIHTNVQYVSRPNSLSEENSFDYIQSNSSGDSLSDSDSDSPVTPPSNIKPSVGIEKPDPFELTEINVPNTTENTRLSKNGVSNSYSATSLDTIPVTNIKPEKTKLPFFMIPHNSRFSKPKGAMLFKPKMGLPNLAIDVAQAEKFRGQSDEESV